MGCLIIILILFAIMAFFLYAIGVIIAVDIISFIMLLAGIGNYINAKKAVPSEMRCSNCGSDEVMLSSVVSGTTENSTKYKKMSSSNTQIKRQRIATCQKCGFEYDYFTPDDIETAKTQAMGRMVMFGIVFAVCLVLSIWVFGGSSEENSKKETKSTEETMKQNDAKIEDFDYTLENDAILIDRYNGDLEILEIKPEYEVDGKTYVTDLSDFQISNSDISTFILDEGITETHTSIFNGSDIKKIYFPLSMSVIYDYTLSYLHPDEGEKIQIYYAGTEDEWNSVFTDYTTIQGADSTSEAVGQAAADFINGLVGSEFDASLFEYHFSATIDDLK